MPVTHHSWGAYRERESEAFGWITSATTINMARSHLNLNPRVTWQKVIQPRLFFGNFCVYSLMPMVPLQEWIMTEDKTSTKKALTMTVVAGKWPIQYPCPSSGMWTHGSEWAGRRENPPDKGQTKLCPIWLARLRQEQLCLRGLVQ